MNFVAIDVETANADMSSICQVGIARFENGALIQEWKTYVDPEDYFDGYNVHIHGIDESVVKGSPTFPKIANQIHSFLNNSVVVAHTHFDRVSVHRAAARYGVDMPPCTWLDSARVARRTWQDCASSGYGLSDLCQKLGYEFKHHDALEDAKAAAYILIAALEESRLGLDDWLEKVERPIGATDGKLIRRDGSPEGSLSGEVLVFTGALVIPRREAADMAAVLGCKVDPGVTKKTTLLVVGDQDITKLAGKEKSSKHRKAEVLIKNGIPIRILKESDFKSLFKI